MYPRPGAFELCLQKGSARVAAFSKLESRKWPNVALVAEKIVELVESRLAGFDPAVYPGTQSQALVPIRYRC